LEQIFFNDRMYTQLIKKLPVSLKH